MPFSYDIEPTQSNRANRRRHTQESKSLDTNAIEVKALGTRIGDVAFDPNAVDGDGDGLVQEGTPYERPALLSNVPNLIRGLASAATTGSEVFNSEGSWTKGLSTQEIAERAIPDSPTKAVEAIAASIGATGSTATLDEIMQNVGEAVEGGVDGLIFDEEKIAKLRETLANALDESPMFRELVDKFGMPPMLLAKYAKDFKASGAMHDSVVMTMSDSFSVGGIPLISALGNRLALSISPHTRFNGTTTFSISSTKEDTIRHEWGHYLNFLVRNIHPDPEQRDLAGRLSLEYWDKPKTSRFATKQPLIDDLFAFMAEADKGWYSSDKVDVIDGIPWIKSNYGQSSPIEFFAESVAAYLSPKKKTRALLNEEGARVVEKMLGTQDYPTGGLASRSIHSGEEEMSKLSHLQVAELAVPDSMDGLEQMMNELNDMRDGTDNTIEQNLISAFGDDTVIDFHPARVQMLREHVAEMLEANPEFRRLVNKYGMPPVAFSHPDYGWNHWDTPPQACFSHNGAPMILMNSLAFDSAKRFDEYMATPSKNFMQKIKKRLLSIEENSTGNKGLPNTTMMSVGSDYDATLLHEWSHYIHDLSEYTHPDEQTRKDLAFFFTESYDDAKKLGEALELVPDERSQLFDLVDDIQNAVETGSVLPETAPFVRTWYGQSSPIEMFAEALTACIYKDGSGKELNSARMNKIIERMFNPPTGDVTVDVLKADLSRPTGGLQSKSVQRDADGVRMTTDMFNAVMGGAGWLKDATDDEIADAVVPMNVDDMIEMAFHASMYGQPGKVNPQKYFNIRMALEQIIAGKEGHVFMDFSPEGREKAKQVIKDALKESPQFAWMVRNFGMPPVIAIDDKALQAFIDAGGDINDVYDPLQNPHVGGWTWGHYYIALNTASTGWQANAPSGYLKGTTINIPGENPFVGNFGYSRADTLRHEYGHFLWYAMCESYIMDSSRKERAAYFFPNLPEKEALARLSKLRSVFSAKETILSSDESQRQAIFSKFLSHAAMNGQLGNKDLATLTSIFTQLSANPNRWTPDLAEAVQQLFGSVDPNYIEYPHLAGAYALFNRQELWAEAMALFTSPDAKFRNRYMSDELRNLVASSLGLQVDVNGKHETPWKAAGGLASRALPIENRVVTLADNFSAKPRGPIGRGFNELPETRIIHNSPSLVSISMGDDKWLLDAGADTDALWGKAKDTWTTDEGHDAMRAISASLMGLGIAGDKEHDSGIVGAIINGTTGSGNTDVRDEARDMAQHAYAGLSKIATGDEITDKPHSRIVENISPNSPLLTAQINEDISFPLTSFGDDAKMRESLTTPSSAPRALVTLRRDAQVARVSNDEVATAGAFRVASRTTDSNGVTHVALEQSRVFDPSKGITVPVKRQDRSGLASGNRPLTRAESGIPQKAQEEFQSKIDAKRAEIDELTDINKRLRSAMEELQATGSWQGEKYDVRVNDHGTKPPVTFTREQLEEEARNAGQSFDDFIADYVRDINTAGRERKASIDLLERDVKKLQETKEFIAKPKSDNTFHIEELLADPELADELRRRHAEVTGLSYADRTARFTDPSDPTAQYVIHWGASELKGGVLDPSRSRGTDTGSMVGNTRAINVNTAKPFVEDTPRLRKEQEARKQLIKDISSGKELNVGPKARTLGQQTTERNLLESAGFGPWIDDNTGELQLSKAKEELGDRYDEALNGLVKRMQETVDREEGPLQTREKLAKQLEADGYQYSSSYSARQLQWGAGSYGGRYADEGAEIGRGATSGDEAAKSTVTGVHIFRVTPENSTSLGAGEEHLVGKHTPIASLVADNNPMHDNPAYDSWAGWVDMAIQQDIAKRQETGGLASRSSKKLAKKTTKTFKVDGSPRPRPASRQELISRGVPTNQGELQRIIKESPYMKGRDKDRALALIDSMEIDWDAQAKLSKKLEKVLADSPGFEELLGEHDIPMMLVTKYGAVPDEVFTGRKRSSMLRWDKIEGEYHPEAGFISFPTRVVNQESVTNSVSDGPVSTEDIIRHELSHTIHAMAMGRSREARKAYEKDAEKMVSSLEKAIQDAQRAGLSEIDLSSVRVLPDEEHELAGQISRYAQSKRSEYIAELITHMFPGPSTKPVPMLDAHYKMLSEFLDIPVAKLRELSSKNMNSKIPWANG